jgi:hypothetical protein
MTDITAVLYTANFIPDKFMYNTQKQLLGVLGDTHLITVSQKPMKVGENVVVELGRSHFNIYRQALLGAKMAKTKYIALCEDDVLYSPEHFNYRPKDKPFAYNLASWGIYTWQKPPMFNLKNRINLNALICEREAFIRAMEERFEKWPDDTKTDKNIWAEPGKYERQLGVTPCEFESYYTYPPNIKFSHETELSFEGLGTRKRKGDLLALSIPYWGSAAEVMSNYA